MARPVDHVSFGIVRRQEHEEVNLPRLLSRIAGQYVSKMWPLWLMKSLHIVHTPEWLWNIYQLQVHRTA